MDTVGRNQKKIENYIRQQLQEDVVADRPSLFELYDPFTGEKNPKEIEDNHPSIGLVIKVVQKGKHSVSL